MQPGEERAVEELLKASVDSDAEARLVDQLRATGAMAGEMVLPLADQTIGYYALSHMRCPKGWLALAPVAIDPDHQHQGHGRRMLGQLTSWAKATKQWIVVLGDPSSTGSVVSISSELLIWRRPIRSHIRCWPDRVTPCQKTP